MFYFRYFVNLILGKFNVYFKCVDSDCSWIYVGG